MQLRVPPTVAYNTRVGTMFLPRNCVGRDPAICMSGPIYNNYGLRCPRGVLTNDDSHRKQCFVTVRGNATPSHDIQELEEGTFAILSPGEPFQCYCAGQASIKGILQPGLSVLTVNRGVALVATHGHWKGCIRRLPLSLGSCQSLMFIRFISLRLFPTPPFPNSSLLQRGNRCLSCPMLNYILFSKCRTKANFRIFNGMVM